MLFNKNLNWHTHIETRLKKKIVFFFSYKLKTSCKLGLYKSLLFPVLAYGFNCVAFSKFDMSSLEKPLEELSGG